MNLPAHSWTFARFRLEEATRRLLFDGQLVALKPQAFDLLLLLVTNNGRVVSKDEILDALWSGRFVEEAILTQNIYEVRRALATGNGERFVENVPKRGYRFVADARRDSHHDEPSVAVLPFRILGHSVDAEHIGPGLAEAMISALTRLERLVVRAAAASARENARERDPLRAAQTLRVRFVVDGSIQLTGERLRIIIQLIDSAVASVIWSDRFDGELARIFELQDVISSRVANAVGLEVGPREQRLLEHRDTSNPSAYQLYLKGRYNCAKASPQSLWRALEFFQQAIAIDERFALAWVGVADAYTSLDWYGVLSTRDSNPHAIAAARRALELDDSLAEAHASCARALQYAWDWSGAEREYRLAIALAPALPSSRQWYASFLAFTMRFDEALTQIERAQSLDPADPSIAAQVGLVLLCARRYDEAAAAVQQALALDGENVEARFYLAMIEVLRGNVDDGIALYRQLPPENPDFRAGLAYAFGMAGRETEARAIIAELVAQESGYVPPFWLAIAQIGVGDYDAAVAALMRAADDPDDSLLAISAFAMLDPIREREEFGTVLLKMGLLDVTPSRR